MIISVANTKGGCGKSTLACNLAVMCAKDKKSVVLFDLDPQRSAYRFREMRMDKDCVQFPVYMSGLALVHDIKNNSLDSTERIIVDSGGRDSKLFRTAMLAADILLIPVEPGQFDLLALEETMIIYDDVRTIKPVKAIIVINKNREGRNLSNVVFTTIKEIAADHGVSVANSKLGDRAGFGEATVNGLGIVECSGKNYDYAKAEMKALYEEIFQEV